MEQIDDIGYSNIRGDSLSRLVDVVINLKRGDDIKGAVLVEGDSDIIVLDTSWDPSYKNEIPNIMKLLNHDTRFTLDEEQKGIFSHHVFDYNGLMIMARRLMDRFTLLVVLKKHPYISLASLDLENSTRRITEILRGCQAQTFF